MLSFSAEGELYFRVGESRDVMSVDECVKIELFLNLIFSERQYSCKPRAGINRSWHQFTKQCFCLQRGQNKFQLGLCFRYKLSKYISVLMISVGIAVCTIVSADSVVSINSSIHPPLHPSIHPCMHPSIYASKHACIPNKQNTCHVMGGGWELCEAQSEWKRFKYVQTNDLTLNILNNSYVLILP